MQKTLSIIKPDGVMRNLIGKILERINSTGLSIAATKLIHMTKADAQRFYEVHKDRPFYEELCDYMCSGPVLVSVLEGSNAIDDYRMLMGATDPKKAKAGTLRADFSLSIGENTVHGSDSPENAEKEIKFLFSQRELVNTKLG
jgi:nucleoside-diphosphate kinase